MPGDFGVSSWKLTFFSGFCAAMYRDGSMIGILINLIFRKGNLNKAGAIIVKERGQLVFCGLNRSQSDLVCVLIHHGHRVDISDVHSL